MYFIRFAAFFLLIFLLLLLEVFRSANRPSLSSACRCRAPNAEAPDDAVSVTMAPNSFIVLPIVCAKSLLVVSYVSAVLALAAALSSMMSATEVV